VLISGTHLAEEETTANRDRHSFDSIRIGGSVAELPNSIDSPTVSSVIGGHAAGMVFTASTDLAEKEAAWHGHGLQHGDVVDEPPAVGSISGGYAAGVVRSGADLSKFEAADHQGGRALIISGHAVPDLTVYVPAPAVGATIRSDAAGVPHSGTCYGECQGSCCGCGKRRVCLSSARIGGLVASVAAGDANEQRYAKAEGTGPPGHIVLSGVYLILPAVDLRSQADSHIGPTTARGLERFMVVPSPSPPVPLYPQQ
jgi:hypothetical protein